MNLAIFDGNMGTQYLGTTNTHPFKTELKRLHVYICTCTQMCMRQCIGRGVCKRNDYYNVCEMHDIWKPNKGTIHIANNQRFYCAFCCA